MILNSSGGRKKCCFERKLNCHCHADCNLSEKDNGCRYDESVGVVLHHFATVQAILKKKTGKSLYQYIFCLMGNCPPLNWKVGCSIHGHRVNCCSAPWARAFTATAPARSTIQSSDCRQLSSPKYYKIYYITLTCSMSFVTFLVLSNDLAIVAPNLGFCTRSVF